MSTEIEIEVDPDCNSFQCTSEIILDTDVIKLEVDDDSKYEENPESIEIELEIENVQNGMSSLFFK